jgi:hypothetical protein
MDVHFFLKNRVGNQEIKNISDSQVYRLSWKALVAVFLMPRHVGFFFFFNDQAYLVIRPTCLGSF